MAVISVSITESETQEIAGIPETISISVNIPSTIFYTLDGEDPTVNDLVYVGPIILPTNNPSVTLKIYATNGVDESPIITRTYSPSVLGSKRPHATVQGLTPGGDSISLYPYGDNIPSKQTTYGRPGGITVDAPDVPGIPDGYNGLGGRARETDKPLNEYQFVYSTTNRKGETDRGIGTLPGTVTIQVPESPPESSKIGDRLFNPKALVIYQDSRESSPNEIPMINRANFTLQNVERSEYGQSLMSTAFDSNQITGSFIRQHFNPKNNTMTYYYRDSDSGRWIISVEPFRPKTTNVDSLNHIIFSPRESRHVYRWIPFMYNLR